DLCLLYGQHLNSENAIVNQLIKNSSVECNPSADSLRVKKGDRIYFRVHSVANGNPPIKWDPKVSYVNLPSNMDTIDQNGYTIYSSSYSDGFKLSQPTSFVFPEQEGDLSITWDDFEVIQPSDNV